MKKSIIGLCFKIIVVFLILISFNLLVSANNQTSKISEKEVRDNICIDVSLNYDINLDNTANATIYIDILNRNEIDLGLKSLLIKVVELPGNITNVEVESPFFSYGPYLFCWDTVSENHSGGLQGFLMENLAMGWVENATINKFDDNKTIHISTNGNSAKITLDEKKKEATLKINDGRIFNLKVKEKGGKRYIYWSSFRFKHNCSSSVECIQNVKPREYFCYVEDLSSEKTWNKYFYVDISNLILHAHAMTHLYISYSTDNIVRDPKDITKYLYVPPQGFDNVWVELSKCKYQFHWDNVPGNDSDRLRGYLRHDLNIGWVKNATINKSVDNKTIHIFTNENTAEITLDEKKENAILWISDGRILNLKVRGKGSKLTIDRPVICSQTKNYNILINLPQNRWHYSQLMTVPHPHPDAIFMNEKSPALSWHFSPEDNRSSTFLLVPAYKIQKDTLMVALDTLAALALYLGVVSIVFAVQDRKRRWVLIVIGVVGFLIILIPIIFIISPWWP